MKLTERQTFKTTEQQKETLIVLNKKYNINTSEFIRVAIYEKLQRDRNTIFKNYKEVERYLKELGICPF